MDLDKHIAEITRLRLEADALPEDNPSGLMNKIELLAKCLVFIGRVSSFLDGEYKRIYALRKATYAQSYTEARNNKAASAELAVIELRKAEAEAYEKMNRWRNAFASTTEEIHALKMRMKMDFSIEGGANNASR